MLVQLSGSYDYYDGTPFNLGFIVKDTGIIISAVGVFSDSLYPLRRHMNNFYGATSWKEYQNDPNYTVEDSYGTTSYRLYFSQNSDRIDSGVCYRKYRTYRRWKWGEINNGYADSVSFGSIPVVSVESDTVQYQIKGNSLQSILSTVVITSYDIMTDDARKFNSINWESSIEPILTIKLFK